MPQSRKTKMDPRCPRKLATTPDSWCPLAVLRLKALRNAGKELTEEEESKLPGCPWAIDHQLAGYCFFKFIDEFIGDKPPSDMEMASYLCVSIDSIKQIEKNALEKLKATKELSDLGGDGPVISDNNSDEYSIKR